MNCFMCNHPVPEDEIENRDVGGSGHVVQYFCPWCACYVNTTVLYE